MLNGNVRAINHVVCRCISTACLCLYYVLNSVGIYESMREQMEKMFPIQRYYATFRTVSVRVRADGQRAVKLAVESVISSIRENFTEFIHFTHRRPWSWSGRRLKLTEQCGRSTRRQQPAHPLFPCTENCHRKRTLTFTDGPFTTGMRTGEEKARRSGHPKLLKTLW